MLAQWRADGYGVVEGSCLRRDRKNVSGTPQERARDFHALWAREDVRAIIPPWGGELLIEILPHIDFAALAASEPKWVLGYSDVSTLLFPLTLRTRIASAHGLNLMDLIRGQVFGVTEAYLRHLATPAGGHFEQVSFPSYQIGFTPFEEQVDAKFNPVERVRWEVQGALGADGASFQGRLIGGCLDTITCLVGTPYGDLPAFTRQNSSDGVILYLENCEMTPSQVARHLRQMRLAGWFEGLSGVVFGRSTGPDTKNADGFSYRDAVASVTSDLGIPVVLDADIGHRPPQMLLINGAWADFKVEDGQARVRQELRP